MGLLNWQDYLKVTISWQGYFVTFCIITCVSCIVSVYVFMRKLLIFISSLEETIIMHVGSRYRISDDDIPEYNYCRTDRNKVFYYILFPNSSLPKNFRWRYYWKFPRRPYPNTVQPASWIPIISRIARFYKHFPLADARIHGFNIQDDVSVPWKCHYTAM